MSRKAEEYVMGILFPYENRTEIKYVTSISSKSKIAKWDDGQNAMTFSKAYAKDLAWGLTLNNVERIVFAFGKS